MYHLRLCKALSYTGVVSATKQQPDVFVEDKGAVKKVPHKKRAFSGIK